MANDWDRALSWVQLAGDLGIAAACLSIPLLLWRLLRRREDLRLRGLVLLFALFVLSFGLTHLAAVWGSWRPDPGVQVVFTGITALVSLATVVALWRALPKAAALRNVARFEAMEEQLERESEQRRQAEERSRRIMGERLESMGLLAAGVAHGINNPLAYVLANLDFSLGELRSLDRTSRPLAQPHELVEALEQAREGATRIRDLVAALSSLSRHEEASVTLEVGPILGSALRMTGNAIRQRARLEEKLRPMPRVHAEPSQLLHVFINLLVNATQSLDEQRADRNRVMVETGTDEHGWAVVEVRDTGCGIDPDVVHAIFDPFFTTKPFGQGSGLGLSVAHGIVTAVGGEIRVQSTPGVGSSFRVRLPPARDGEPAPEPAARKHGHGRKLRVLVVDDEPGVVTALSRLLSRGHEVTGLSSGREALQLLLGGQRFDLVLCDLMMPAPSGIELYETLIDRAPAQARRLHFMTGGAFTDRAREFVERHPERVVEKPIDPVRLRALLEGVEPLAEA